MALGQVFLWVLCFFPINNIPPWLSILIHNLGNEQKTSQWPQFRDIVYPFDMNINTKYYGDQNLNTKTAMIFWANKKKGYYFQKALAAGHGRWMKNQLCVILIRSLLWWKSVSAVYEQISAPLLCIIISLFQATIETSDMQKRTEPNQSKLMRHLPHQFGNSDNFVQFTEIHN
jgi:hypothetical protein